MYGFSILLGSWRVVCLNFWGGFCHIVNRADVNQLLSRLNGVLIQIQMLVQLGGSCALWPRFHVVGTQFDFYPKLSIQLQSRALGKFFSPCSSIPWASVYYFESGQYAMDGLKCKQDHRQGLAASRRGIFGPFEQ